MRTFLSFLISLMTIPETQANPLDKFLESLGGQTNASQAGSYKDQAAGYYTGGGYVMRQTNGVVQPINISLPNLGAGCNSLDMYFGSLSFLQTDKLVQLGRQVVTGIPTYGFQLALKTLSPQIENLLSQLRKYVQDMNATMLNSCQMTQQIVGGLWPRGTAASEQICMDHQKSGNTDWFGARGHCEKPESLNKTVDAVREKYKDLLMGDYNLVWHVLKKMPAYKDNKELASFVMTVTGTLISSREDGRIRFRLIEPRADQRDFVAAYLKGGMTSGLVCNDSDRCLAPALKEMVIPDSQSMKARVTTRIGDLRAKYLSEENVTEADIHFLNDAVNVPVYRYIQISVAAGTVFMMEEAAEHIAANVLLAQFDRVMTEILAAVDDLQKIQLEDTAIADFKGNLQAARGRVQAALIGVNNSSIHLLNQAIQAIEQAVISRNN